jgi:hypothetical protein
MASSVASAGTSPMSGYDFQTDSTGDQDENLWMFLNAGGSSVSSNAALSFSPASLPGSMSSWAMVNSRSRQVQQPPSPLNLDLDQDYSSFPSSTYGDAIPTGFSVTSAPAEGQFVPDGQPYLTSEDMLFGDTTFSNNNITDLGKIMLSQHWT